MKIKFLEEDKINPEKVADFFKDLKESEKSEIRQGAFSIADDDPEGDRQVIDTTRELYALSVWIENHPKYVLLKRGIGEHAKRTARFLGKHLSGANVVKQEEIDGLYTDHISNSYRGEYLKIKERDPVFQVMDPHHQYSKELIEVAVDAILAPEIRLSDRRLTVMVLGAGACHDIPIEALAAKFQVILVDLDAERMQHCVERLSSSLKQYVSYEVRDITGGFASNLAKNLNILIESVPAFDDSKRQKAFEEFEPRMMQTIKDSEPFVPLLTDNHRVDFIISSLVISDVAAFLEAALDDSLIKKFRVGWDAPSLTNKLKGKIYTTHIEALVDSTVRGVKGVFFASDIAEGHYSSSTKGDSSYSPRFVYFDRESEKAIRLPRLKTWDGFLDQQFPNRIFENYFEWVRYEPYGRRRLNDAVLITPKKLEWPQKIFIKGNEISSYSKIFGIMSFIFGN